jgi:hypothetical protein
MYPSVPGVYRNGKVELAEEPGPIPEETQVVVTFMTSQGVDLSSRGIRADQAAELRARLSTFAEEWDSPEMEVYDRYDASRPGV